MQALAEYKVEAGDVFFLPAGRIHAIGAGCFVAEIQQTSDITYRIYDYDRPDANGRLRELHTEWAKDAIDYRMEDSYKTAYTHRISALLCWSRTSRSGATLCRKTASLYIYVWREALPSRTRGAISSNFDRDGVPSFRP